MSELYQASRIRRKRATAADMESRYVSLLAIVAAQRPMTVRQVFYQASVQGIIEKTEPGYDKVCEGLTHLRRAKRLPYNWLADSTRWMRKPRSFSGIAHAIEMTARTYRKAIWNDTDAYVEVWLEKDALAGVVVDVTEEYDVPLMVARGYSSLSFLNGAAETIAAQDRPCFIYHFGDWDPSGVNAAEKIDETLKAMAPEAEIVFERVAVTPEQIEGWNLQTRPTKASDSRSKKWTGGESVELDAIPADYLRDLVRQCILTHIDEEQLRVVRVAEASEREALAMFALEARL